MRRRIAHGLAIWLAIAGLGAAQGRGSSEFAKTRGSPELAQIRPIPKSRAYQVGTASWYGGDFQGRITASGEPYNMYDLTAAHPTLPIGAHVRVTNLRNGRSVVVRINDRGPIVPGRIIDVSYSSAQALQFKSQGLQRVRLDVVSSPQRPSAELRTIAYQP